ncbi:MAG TPA: hypothetical protein VGR21_00900 [Cryptosporangiaceae bacterium]|nr:hypothetical protein [Cryptosporangiaceae bacterium]
MRWWTLNREQAHEYARVHAEIEGLPWAEPATVMRRPLGGWDVITRAGEAGGKLWLHISRRGRVTGGLRDVPS